jgi:methylated-DNA-[protein]-cysteine S-methyltransferase
MHRGWLETPIGLLEAVESGGAIVRVGFKERTDPREAEDHPLVTECLRQLQEYFAGRRREFRLALDPGGTDFQRRVWDELEKIPFGATTTYGVIAQSLGCASAVRAVGGANARNPIAVIIPCHRVIGAGGGLVGYGGGLWRKKWLLDHEAAARPGRP